MKKTLRVDALKPTVCTKIHEAHSNKRVPINQDPEFYYAEDIHQYLLQLEVFLFSSC